MVIAERIPRTLLAARGLLTHRAYPVWVRQWQFWVVLGIGALLRLFAIGRSPFGSDDALLFLEAGRVVHDHLLPGTGIYNSVLALNMPLYTFILLPFATNPQALSVVTALANVGAVAGWYVFVQRFFSRRAALIAGLLFATACYDTYMSGFVWQQTIIAPLTVVVFATAYLGALERKRHWLVPHVLALAALIQIYPIMAALVPLTLIAVWFGRHAVSWLDVAITGAGTVVLYIPAILFELGSHGYDLPIYAAYLRAPKHTDAQVFDAFAQALGPRPADFFGAGTPYFHAADRFAWLTPALMVLWLASTLWLLGALVAPLIPLVRSLRAFRLAAFYREISRPAWLSAAMLLVWPLVFVAITVRHSSTIYVHYVFEITPVIYCTIALFLTRFPGQIGAFLGRLPVMAGAGRGLWPRRHLPGMLRGAPAWLALGVALLIIVAQTMLTSLLVFTLGTGQAAAASWSATPALGYMRVMDATNAWAERLHSRNVLLVADPGDPYMGLYWSQRANDLASGNAPLWSSTVETDCSISPSRSMGPAVVIAISAAGGAFQWQLASGGLHVLQRYTPARGEVFTVYRADPSAAGDQRPLASVNGELQLDSVSLLAASGPTPARLVSDWTVLHTTPPGPAVRQYFFHETVTAPHATPVTLNAACTPSAWIAGERVEVVSALPAGVNASDGLMVRFQVAGGTHSWYQPRIGSLVLETAKEVFTEPVTLPVSGSPQPAVGGSGALPVQLGPSSITVPLPAPAS